MKNLQHQKGMTAMGIMIVLGLIGFFALLALRLAPMYLESSKVNSVFESLENEPGITKKSARDIRLLLYKRFNVNQIDQANVDPKNATITRDGGILKMGVAWERREPFFGEIFLVGVFDKNVEVPIR